MMIKPFDEINKQHRKKILKNLESNTITFKENDNILSSFKNSKLIGIIQKGSISIIREDYNGNIIVLDKINQYELFIEELCILSSDDKVIANTDTVISFFYYDLIRIQSDNSDLDSSNSNWGSADLIKGNISGTDGDNKLI